MALEAMNPRDFKYFTHEDRRPSSGYQTTLAMHWDGTYRDRVSGTKTLFWNNDTWSRDPAINFAKHLA